MASSSRVSFTPENHKRLLWGSFLGFFSGAALGASLYKLQCSELVIEIIGYPGEMYLRALQQLTLPVIIFSLMTGMFRMKKSAGRVIRWSLAYYSITMFLAMITGITLVYFVKPGQGAPLAHASRGCSSQENSTTLHAIFLSKDDTPSIDPFLDIGRDLIPENLVQAAAKSNYLAFVACATVCAIVINTFGDRASYLIQLIDLFNDIFLKIVFGVLAVTPIAFCSLAANAILKACDISSLLHPLGLYTLTVLGGFSVHTFVVLPLTVIVLSRRNPFKQLRVFSPALVMALGSSSSTATLPMTMQCAEASGCDSSLVRFVIPFGSNFNRDGSALYQAISVLFICQAHGVNLSMRNLFGMALAASVTSIAVPNSGLVTMIGILQVVGFPQYVGDVSKLYALDWFLGAIRSSVNVWGDACACNIVDEWTKRYKCWNGSSVESDYLQEPLLP